METHIIFVLSLALLILLFVMWKDRREHRKNQERLIQETLALQKQINQLENLVSAILRNNQKDVLKLENLVKALPQNNQRDALKDVFAEIIPQEINGLSDIARQAEALAAEIFRLQLVRLGLANDNRLNFRNVPPDLSGDNPYWRDLSRWIREEKRWTCEKCRINLEERRSDLHAHHVFGRGFNSPQHLKVLCIACHAEEPYHEFMKAHPEYQAFLKWRADR